MLNFGPSGGLVGVLTRPEVAAADLLSRPAVVLLNAGVIHRVGPSRIHVRLARRLAEMETTSFRLDLPGLGDSRGLGGSELLLDDALAGIKAAFDALERHGVADRFVVFGLCSGAAHAFAVATSDARVRGIVLADPPVVFPTWKSINLKRFRRFWRPSVWHGVVTGRYGPLTRLRAVARGAQVPAPVSSVDQHQVREQLRALAARGVKVFYLSTGAARDYVYRRQFLDAFPGLGLERLTSTEMFPDASHTFTREADRRDLEEAVATWVTTTSFPR